MSPLDPLFTVVVPTYNRPAALSRCLEGLRSVRVPDGGVEVVVVDDGGEADLESSVAEHREPLRVRVLRQENAGSGKARNTAAASARGRWLVFIADDCLADRDWLVTLADAFARSPEAMLGGRVVNAAEDSLAARANDLLIRHMYEHHNRDPRRASFFTPNNMAVPRERFLELGGFDARTGPTGEDRELCNRWRARGWPMEYVENAAVYHDHPQTLPGFWRQHMAYGRGSLRYHRIRRELAGDDSQIDTNPSPVPLHKGGRVLPEPLPFYIGLLSRPLRERGVVRGLPEAALLAMSQAATAAGMLGEAVRGRG